MDGRLRRSVRFGVLLAAAAVLVALVAACTPSSPGETPSATFRTPTAAGVRTSAPSGPTAAGVPATTPLSTPTRGTVTQAPGTRTAVATSAAKPVTVGEVSNGPAIFAANGHGFSQIDPQTGQILNTTTTGFDVRDITISPDGRFAYLVVGLPKLSSLPGVAGATTGGTPTPGGAVGTVTPATGTPATGTANGLVVYDLATRSQLGQVAVGGDPWAIALSRDGRFAFISNRADGTVSVVDTAALAVTATLTAGTQPTGLAIFEASSPAPVVVTPSATAGSRTPAPGSPAPGTPAARSTVRTATAGSGTATAVRTATTGAFVPKELLFVANYGSDDVSVVDLSTNRIVSKISVGKSPIAIAADPTNNRVFVANLGSSDLSVIGVVDGQIESRVRLDGRPSSVGVSVDGRLVYVTLTAPTNAVQVVNPALITAGATTPLGTPTPAPTSTRTPTAGTPAAGAGTPAASATAQSTGTPTPVPSRIAVGNNPSDVVFDSQGTRAFIANADDGTISIVDTAIRAVVGTGQLAGQLSGLDYSMGSARATPSPTGSTPALVTPTTVVLPATPSATGTSTPAR